jgi:hypothetical protein
MDLIIQSEGRASPKSGEPGHTLAQHVGGDDSKSGGRLMASVQSSASTPIIMNPATGAVAERKEMLEIYVSAGNFPSKTKAGKAYDDAFTAGKQAAGAFLDIQQAHSVLQYAMNSTEGQTALGNLDGGSAREFFTVSVLDWSMARQDCWKMWCAYVGAGGNDKSDLTHLEDFKKVTVGIDKLGGDEVHLQTFYPVRE